MPPIKRIYSLLSNFRTLETMSLNIRTKPLWSESVSDLNSLPVSFAEIHAERSRPKTQSGSRARDAERWKGQKGREAIGNGYLAKTKLDFYGGQVLIKFRKLEENLGERVTATSRNPPPTRAFHCSDFPLSAIGFNPYTLSFSHFPLWNRMLGKLDK